MDCRSDRKECARLLGVRVADDEALAELRSALMFSRMGFLEKGREGMRRRWHSTRRCSSEPRLPMSAGCFVARLSPRRTTGSGTCSLPVRRHHRPGHRETGRSHLAPGGSTRRGVFDDEWGMRLLFRRRWRVTGQGVGRFRSGRLSFEAAVALSFGWLANLRPACSNPERFTLLAVKPGLPSSVAGTSCRREIFPPLRRLTSARSPGGKRSREAGTTLPEDPC